MLKGYLSCEKNKPPTTRQIPIIFCKFKSSPIIKKEKTPVKTGIRFANILVLLTPISRVAMVKATNAMDEQNTARATIELMTSKFGRIEIK
jgi:hypothetical protein